MTPSEKRSRLLRVTLRYQTILLPGCLPAFGLPLIKGGVVVTAMHISQTERQKDRQMHRLQQHRGPPSRLLLPRVALRLQSAPLFCLCAHQRARASCSTSDAVSDLRFGLGLSRLGRERLEKRP